MSLIHIGLSGTLAAQAALNMAGRNTANLKTPGYSRQGVLLAAHSTGGVGVQSLLRFSDNYKTQQMWAANGPLGQYKTASSYFSQLENVMDMGDGSVKAGLDAFFNALQEVSTDPTSGPLRQQFLSSADALAKGFNNLQQRLSGQLGAARQHGVAAVDQVNGLSRTIADLNQKIGDGYASGSVPSELIDQRDSAIDALAGLVEIRTLQQPSGAVDVSIAGGPPLVAGSQVGTMSVQNHADGTFSFSLKLAGTAYPLTGGTLGGELGAIASFVDTTLLPQMASIKTLAGEIATRFNGTLAAGYGMNGQPGHALFDFDPATGLLNVRAGLTQQDLGFSGNPDEPGNSDNLLKLIGLRRDNITLPGIGEVSIGDALTVLIGKVGSASQQNEALLGTATSIRDYAEDAWLSVSGVNMDEEAVNISEYLQMYQANMKVIAVANELFDATLAMF
ncbi:flagellar hook-associated protein FlgK [Caballeronia sp. LjRoot31]|uniref:flagellar hook-associated protein FlgK n=1 Tax=Caballeronia sp. LjRoot31 TaxID=3342324 RepID=UPI003ECC803B